MQNRLLAAALSVFTLATLAVVQGYQTGDGRRYFAPRTKADAALPPFSGAVLANHTLYLAGELGTDANNKLPDTPEAEAKAVLDKIQARLKSAGMTMDDLVSVQIFCSDVRHYAAFNEVYRGYFSKEYPARAFIGSGGLLFGARFEVMGTAVKR